MNIATPMTWPEALVKTVELLTNDGGFCCGATIFAGVSLVGLAIVISAWRGDGIVSLDGNNEGDDTDEETEIPS